MRHPVVEFVPAWRRDTLLEKVMEDRPDARNLEVIRQLKANKAITFDAHEQGVDIFLGNKYLFSLKDFTWLKTQIENLDARDADPLVARCNLTAMKRVYFT